MHFLFLFLHSWLYVNHCTRSIVYSHTVQPSIGQTQRIFIVNCSFQRYEMNVTEIWHLQNGISICWNGLGLNIDYTGRILLYLYSFCLFFYSFCLFFTAFRYLEVLFYWCYCFIHFINVCTVRNEHNTTWTTCWNIFCFVGHVIAQLHNLSLSFSCSLSFADVQDFRVNERPVGSGVLKLCKVIPLF